MPRTNFADLRSFEKDFVNSIIPDVCRHYGLEIIKKEKDRYEAAIKPAIHILTNGVRTYYDHKHLIMDMAEAYNAGLTLDGNPELTGDDLVDSQRSTDFTPVPFPPERGGTHSNEEGVNLILGIVPRKPRREFDLTQDTFR